MKLETTHLYKEIHEQPAVLRRFLNEQKEPVQALAQAIRRQNINHIIIAARGTSDNAGRYAQYVLGAQNRLMVTLATPSLFTIYQRPPQMGNALVLGISQSGKSPDIVAVLAEAKKQGALTAVLTNIPDSDLGRQGDVVVDLCAGEETAVAATKTYTSELTAVALLSATLANDAAMFAALEKLPDAVKSTLAMQENISQIAPRYRYMERTVVIGRGYNYATAFELALKMKELTYTIAEPYSSADFRHGPLALIDQGFPVIVIAPSGQMLPEMKDFMHTLRQRQAELIAISDDNDALALARIPLALPASVPEWLSPIAAIVPGQMLAMNLAHARDFDVDAPRGIQKVTETR
ncbi:MAG: SIS domain-containing protein [Ardenticatenaceae bacterium]|nr:SIS domain-containing protein [Ardenticatenaceae bacterium]MCB9445045.1 SIS domain-containing protein [Ardenticatenaceae bacterium]